MLGVQTFFATLSRKTNCLGGDRYTCGSRCEQLLVINQWLMDHLLTWISLEQLFALFDGLCLVIITYYYLFFDRLWQINFWSILFLMIMNCSRSWYIFRFLNQFRKCLHVTEYLLHLHKWFIMQMEIDADNNHNGNFNVTFETVKWILYPNIKRTVQKYQWVKEFHIVARVRCRQFKWVEIPSIPSLLEFWSKNFVLQITLKGID